MYINMCIITYIRTQVHDCVACGSVPLYTGVADVFISNRMAFALDALCPLFASLSTKLTSMLISDLMC